METLPTVSDYRNFLEKAVNKFNLTINQARNLYGNFTYKQWNELLN